MSGSDYSSLSVVYVYSYTYFTTGYEVVSGQRRCVRQNCCQLEFVLCGVLWNPSRRVGLGSVDMKCLLGDFITHSLLSFLFAGEL